MKWPCPAGAPDSKNPETLTEILCGINKPGKTVVVVTPATTFPVPPFPRSPVSYPLTTIN
ncbi:MAG: hypothetical protein LBI44_04120 [Oscillospiraceae bacterium]|jgi:hypothetical protein|nr:hypothetical protein [Oscillospiraceae bacterium]